jgi:hypothetical protein
LLGGVFFITASDKDVFHAFLIIKGDLWYVAAGFQSLICLVFAYMVNKDLGQPARGLAIIALFYIITPDKGAGALNEIFNFAPNSVLYNAGDLFKLTSLKLNDMAKFSWTIYQTLILSGFLIILDLSGITDNHDGPSLLGFGLGTGGTAIIYSLGRWLPWYWSVILLLAGTIATLIGDQEDFDEGLTMAAIGATLASIAWAVHVPVG